VGFRRARNAEFGGLNRYGKSQFYELMRLMTPTFCAFDLLWLNGKG
jgi:hypothetical protein